MDSLGDWIFDEKYLREKAQKTGVSYEKEIAYRNKTIWFMENLGKTIACHRDVVSVGSIFFHRFYAFHSFKNSSYDRFEIAVACIFLASKVCEFPIKLRDLVKAYIALKVGLEQHELPVKLKRVLIGERILLNTICFDLNVTLPKEDLSLKRKDFRSLVPREARDKIRAAAQTFINDSYRSPICLQFTNEEITTAVFFLANIQLQVKPDLGPSSLKFRNSNSKGGDGSGGVEQAWFDILEKYIDEGVLKSICNQILDMYDSSMTAVVREDSSSLDFPTIQARVNSVQSSSSPAAQIAPDTDADTSSAYVEASPQTVVNAPMDDISMSMERRERGGRERGLEEEKKEQLQGPWASGGQVSRGSLDDELAANESKSQMDDGADVGSVARKGSSSSSGRGISDDTRSEGIIGSTERRTNERDDGAYFEAGKKLAPAAAEEKETGDDNGATEEMKSGANKPRLVTVTHVRPCGADLFPPPAPTPRASLGSASGFGAGSISPSSMPGTPAVLPPPPPSSEYPPPSPASSVYSFSQMASVSAAVGGAGAGASMAVGAGVSGMGVGVGRGLSVSGRVGGMSSSSGSGVSVSGGRGSGGGGEISAPASERGWGFGGGSSGDGDPGDMSEMDATPAYLPPPDTPDVDPSAVPDTPGFDVPPVTAVMHGGSAAGGGGADAAAAWKGFTPHSGRGRSDSVGSENSFSVAKRARVGDR